jgi:hypothetical protein
MAVTVEYQAWTSGNYNWLDKTTATSAPLQINDKLDAWVAAVNANASNTNKQITVRKDPGNSTSANFIGWVLELASNTSAAAPFFLRLYSSTTTNLAFTASASWTDDGTNGGYGVAAGSTATDTSISWAASGVTAEFSIAQETADGVEFFCLGWRLNNATAQSDQLVIFKDNNGEWATLFSDGGAEAGCFYSPVSGATPSRNFAVQTNSVGMNANAGYLSQLQLANAASTYLPATGEEFTNTVTAASSALYLTDSTVEYGFGRWASLSGGRTAVCMGFGPIWVVY